MKVQYSSEFKRLVLQRLLADPEVGTRPLARELGVAKSTIWSWQQELAKVTEHMPPTEKRESYNGVKPRSADDKMELVIKSSALTGEAQARYLRTNGITDGDIAAWRNEMLQGLTPVVVATKPKSTKKDAARIATLEKQLRGANALLELKKKMDLLWGLQNPPTEEELTLKTKLEVLRQQHTEPTLEAAMARTKNEAKPRTLLDADASSAAKKDSP